jgi:carbon-monoxide dehydrogenase medium subunit
VKAARFEYLRARDAAHAVSLLSDPDARVIAGGQSLGPMLNLRLARPSLLVDVSACEDLRGYVDEGDAIVYGAAITHAEIEDGKVPDALNGHLAMAARHIAYRAVRNRGTIGGSIAHADPAADWPTVLLAAGAEVVIRSASGLRAMALGDFITGPFATILDPDEVLVGVRVMKRDPALRWSYQKVSVKVGEFAHAFAVAMNDPARGEHRVVVGAIERVPLVIEEPDAALSDSQLARDMLAQRLPSLTPIQRQRHAATLSRVLRGLDGAEAAP